MSTELPITLNEDETDLLLQLLADYDETQDLSHPAWAQVYELSQKLHNLMDEF